MRPANRVMVAGTSSGCGKTTLTCALLQALVDRGLDVAAFKCGPDYIDPMFHSRITGAKCRNLDPFFHNPAVMRYLLRENAGEVSLLEGAMGYYDGAGDLGSSWQAACATGTPAVLVLDCKGMGQSVGAVMEGFLRFRHPSQIAGFIFNRLSPRLVPTARQMCQALGVAYLGYFPPCPECGFPSRHLGLVTAAEVEDLKERARRLAELARRHLDLDALLALAASAPALPAGDVPFPPPVQSPPVPVAWAYDQAFCFYYADDLALLRHLGCRLVPFSPLKDQALPGGCVGLLLGGGYPELHAAALAANRPMRQAIRQAVTGGLPTLAECGGFLYLHNTLEDDTGTPHNMVGVIPGAGFRTGRLQRFGYTLLTARQNNLLCNVGETLKAHEFHYWDSTAPGQGFTAQKVSSGQCAPCAWASPTLYAGFPHLNLCASPAAAARFVSACAARLG